MALRKTITDRSDVERLRCQIWNHQITGSRGRSTQRPYLTHDEAAEVNRSPAKRQQFDCWRSLPTLELHYYPKGVAPEDQTNYVRFLP